MSGAIVVFTEPVHDAWPAVRDVAPTVCELFEELARFLLEGMLVAVTDAVEPPHLTGRCRRCESMEHGQHRSRSYARAQQDNRSGARFQREISSRCAYLDIVANCNVIVQERARCAILLKLHAHTVHARTWRARQGVIPQNGR